MKRLVSRIVFLSLCEGLLAFAGNLSSLKPRGITPATSKIPTDPALQLVNKKQSLGIYKPSDLVSCQGKMVSKRIVNDLKRLLQAAKADGLTLKIISGYRSYERQAEVFNSWVAKELKKNPKLSRKQAETIADTYSARPGHSEHQLGTTVDILSSENGFQFSCDKKLKYVGWLEKNASKFSFKISYPEDCKEYQYEPWHLRWYPSY